MRNNKRRAKRIVALIASIVLVVGLMPAQALAEATDGLTGQTQVVGIEAIASVDSVPADDAEKVVPDVPAEGSASLSSGNMDPAPSGGVTEADQPAPASGDNAQGGEDAGMGQPANTAGEVAASSNAEQEVHGVVKWNDNDNESGERPEKVTVRLMANDAESSAMEVAGGAYGLWAFSFDKLPLRDPQGNEIVYSVAADDVPGYSVEVVHLGGNAYRITYTRPTPVKPTLTITAKDQKYTYNGQTQGEGDTAYEDPTQIAEKVTVEGLLEGDELTSVVLDGPGQEVGEYTIEVTGFSINNNPSARDKYDVVLVPGTLTIKPADPAKYTVTFVDDDGTVISSASYPEGTDAADVAKPADPTKPPTAQHTYKFAGWSPEVADVTADATYTATYTEETRSYVITFDLAGGTLDGKTGTVTRTCAYGSTITLPEPEREGYAFKHWKGSRYAAGADYKVEGAHTFTAVWGKEPATSDVTLYAKRTKGERPTPVIPRTGDPYQWASGASLAAMTVFGAFLVIAGTALGRRRGQR